MWGDKDYSEQLMGQILAWAEKRMKIDHNPIAEPVFYF